MAQTSNMQQMYDSLPNITSWVYLRFLLGNNAKVKKKIRPAVKVREKSKNTFATFGYVGRK